ncbi:MAG: dihydrolipoyl dehydrogenase [Spirochaetaceae bacterium]|jgi:dihydrolipoamide dehydrogenase|nr:dihydrolipoyl dehydrogenase [Spirochaetaceae bacterium]
MADTRFDVAVIGGGPGGYVCAIRCAQLGKKTVLVENRELGGTCLNRGCIPTKALLHTAEIYDEVKSHGRELGLLGEVSVDYAALAGRKDRVLGRLRKGIEGLVRGRNITLVQDTAVLTGAKTFRAGSGDYRADNIVLATGSEPASIPVPGADRPEVINSDAVLALTGLPDSAVIIGGGVIGVEFATLLSSLGRKAIIIEMLPRILNGMDEEICGAMTKLLTRRGVEIHTGARLREIAAGAVCVYEEGGAEKQASGAVVIMAVGRRPVTQNLGLEAAGISSHKGFVTVDDHLRTNVPGVYAVGDITGKIQLAHAASAQGLAAAANIAGRNAVMHYNIVPACVYTNPEIAGVGMTEAQVIAAGLPYRAGSFPAAANGRSLIMNAADGLVKILTHRDTGEILGAHIMAPRATDLIGELALAMRAEATIEEVADTVHAHPTINEMIMEAAHDVEGLCCHKM